MIKGSVMGIIRCRGTDLEMVQEGKSVSKRAMK